MQRRRLWWSIALMFLVAASLLAVLSTTHVFAYVAHSSVSLAGPTPTPDATTTLQMAQQEETNIQSILSIINILVVVYPILIAVAAALLAGFGIRGFQEFKKQGQDLLEDTKKRQGELEKEEKLCKSYRRDAWCGAV